MVGRHGCELQFGIPFQLQLARGLRCQYARPSFVDRVRNLLEMGDEFNQGRKDTPFDRAKPVSHLDDVTASARKARVSVEQSGGM